MIDVTMTQQDAVRKLPERSCCASCEENRLAHASVVVVDPDLSLNLEAGVARYGPRLSTYVGTAASTARTFDIRVVTAGSLHRVDAQSLADLETSTSKDALELLVTREAGPAVPWACSIHVPDPGAMTSVALAPIAAVFENGIFCIRFDDLCTVLPRGTVGFGMVGSAPDRDRIAGLVASVRTPLLARYPRLSEMRASLMMWFDGNQTLSMHEINMVSTTLAEEMHEDANIVFGSSFSRGDDPLTFLTAIVTFESDDPEFCDEV